MWPRFGIKIGNSTLCVASAKKDGKIEVVANKQGDRVSHAVLYYDGDEIEVGLTAKQKLISKPLSTISNSFQLFSNNLTDDKALKYISCEFDKNTKNFILQSQDNDEQTIIKKMSPFNVCVEMFKACFELARQCHLFEEHPSVVLSIPHYYPHTCWKEFSDAAENAGFHVSQIINETTAALMAYEIDNNNEIKDKSQYFLCIKCGGLLTSFALYELRNGLYTAVGSSQSFYLGGNQFTDVLVNFICEEFQKKYHLNPKESKRSMAKIRTAADNSKHSLTTLQSTQIYIDSLMDGIDFNANMSRARFDNLIQPVINEFMTILNESLEKINKNCYEIDEIILAGGTLKIPKIQNVIKTKFPMAKLRINFSPDEIVAIGCAQQSIYVEPNTKELNSHQNCMITKYDTYIWYDKNFNQRKLLIKKGTILPNKFSTELNNPNDTNDDNDSIYDNAIFNIKYDDGNDNENTTPYKIQIDNVKSKSGIFHLETFVGFNDEGLKIQLNCVP